MDLSEPVSWGEGVRRYLDLYGKLHLAPSSRRRMSIVLEQFGGHLAAQGITALTRVTRHHIETYQLARVTAGKSLATVNADVRHLRSFLRRAKLEGWTPICATDGVKLLRVPKRHEKYRDEPEAARIYRAFLELNQQTWADLLLTVVNTGVRLGEALALRPEDATGGRLHIRVDAGFMPKDREERFIKLNPVAQLAINRRLLTGGTRLWPFSQLTARKYLKRAALKARVPHTTWHSLRHTFASISAATMPEQALMAICGWQDSRTANQHYIHRRIMDLPPPPTVIG